MPANERTRPVPPGRADLLGPQELAELGGLEFLADHVVEGFVAGLHRSPNRGFSVEFAEHRAYQPGDDLRHIDWRMFGRSDRYYVKQYEAETNLRAYLLVDASASMSWSSEPGRLPPKLWYAKALAAAVSVLLLRQGDSVGLIGFDETVRDHLPPRGGRRQRAELIRRLDALAGSGRTEAGSALREVAGRLRRRGLVVLFSDLLVDPEEARLSLQYLRHRGHEVIVFHLLDPGERELPSMRDARFVDPETDEELPVSIADLRGEYREAVEHALAEWERALRPHGAHYVVIDTSQPLVHALRVFLHTRERLG